MQVAHRSEGDAQPFVAQVEAVVAGLLDHHCPKRLRLLHVDNWFGPKWLGFSGKVLGLLGIWRDKEDLTLPPFVPARILAEQLWAADPASDLGYGKVAVDSSIHRRQPSGANLKRLAASVAPGEALVWYSGNSVANQRGSLMAYIPTDDGYRTFYVQWLANPEWVVSQMKGLSPDDLQMLLSDAASKPSC
jgi:hypothetical protein